MRRPRTLRVRLVVAAAGSIVVALVVFGIAAVLLVDHQLRSSLDSALRQRAEGVVELAISAPAVLNYPGALESPVSGRQIGVEVINARGRVVASSPALGAASLPQGSPARAARVLGVAGFTNVDIDGRPYRVYATPIPDAGPAAGGAVLVASDVSDIRETIAHLTFVLILSGVAVALVATVIAAALTRRGLRPLRRLAAAAGEIERTADPARRLPETGTGDEVGQLTGVLNRMLSSLDAARAGERRFLADASHELRTPVTALLGNVEFVARYGADPEVLAELQHDAQRLARLVDELLVLGRADAAPAQAVPVDLSELVPAVVRGLAGDGGRVVLARTEAVVVEGDPDSLGRAVENLVENALVHGPEGGQVTISVSRVDGRALVTVRDEGPGPDPGDRERLFERFWRAPEASGRPGSGLGLSIVSAIVGRHGGRIDVRGSAFTIELPAVESGSPSPSAGPGSPSPPADARPPEHSTGNPRRP
jgi:two-component system, OmpR family, sensor kinase